MRSLLSNCYFLLLFISCVEQEENRNTIENPATYRQFLKADHQQKALQKIDLEIEFWRTKYKLEPRGFVYLEKMGELLSKKFRLDGDINHVFSSDEQYQQALNITNGFNRVGAYQGLSQNALIKHEFQKGKQYADSAMWLGKKAESSILLKLDAMMELGNDDWIHQTAQTYLMKDEFDYLTRRSKYVDAQGDLDSAIQVTILALDKMLHAGNSTMIAWSLANLGDLYMHNGEVEKAYKHYLKVLDLDPSYNHALKGIAWLQYSALGNDQAAMEVLNFISNQYMLPDIFLLKAEIFESLENDSEAQKYYQKFLDEASKVKYGRMYNAHRANVLTALGKTDLASSILREELTYRSTPELYDMLAWCYFRQGSNTLATELIMEKVVDKTEEPLALYHCGKILMSGKNHEKGRKFLSAAAESSIELGPIIMKDIQELIG